MDDITLSREEAHELVCFLLMTTNYRKDEAETWERLATEKDENGNPFYRNAASNARYYRELEGKLTKIREKLDAQIRGMSENRYQKFRKGV